MQMHDQLAAMDTQQLRDERDRPRRSLIGTRIRLLECGSARSHYVAVSNRVLNAGVQSWELPSAAFKDGRGIVVY
jgi:hypothetical protein